MSRPQRSGIVVDLVTPAKRLRRHEGGSSDGERDANEEEEHERLALRLHSPLVPVARVVEARSLLATYTPCVDDDGRLQIRTGRVGAVVMATHTGGGGGGGGGRGKTVAIKVQRVTDFDESRAYWIEWNVLAAKLDYIVRRHVCQAHVVELYDAAIVQRMEHVAWWPLTLHAKEKDAPLWCVFVMEFCGELTLRQALKQRVFSDASCAWSLTFQLVYALGTLYNQLGLVPNDLTLENVVVRRDDRLLCYALVDGRTYFSECGYSVTLVDDGLTRLLDAEANVCAGDFVRRVHSGAPRSYGSETLSIHDVTRKLFSEVASQVLRAHGGGAKTAPLLYHVAKMVVRNVPQRSSASSGWSPLDLLEVEEFNEYEAVVRLQSQPVGMDDDMLDVECMVESGLAAQYNELLWKVVDAHQCGGDEEEEE